MPAYYNEIDPFAAAWLRELIKAGHIAPGEVDERSIIGVAADDLAGYTQCHFFAGIGTWSYALRRAGWPDDRPVWTGSPPCQPFSVAGKGLGKDDDRHLAPHWLELVRECRPAAVFGEQVSAAIRHGWLDDLQDALEREGYACGAVVLPACSVGAPHIRQRLWFVAKRLADTECATQERHGPHSREGLCQQEASRPARSGLGSGLESVGSDTRRVQWRGVGNTGSAGLEKQRCVAGASCEASIGDARQTAERTGSPVGGLADFDDEQEPTYAPNEFWGSADWLYCRDGKWRPVEPGTFPLVDGAPARVGRLRGYGNGIVAQVAQAVIEAYLCP